jgi:hypothetical protein
VILAQARELVKAEASCYNDSRATFWMESEQMHLYEVLAQRVTEWRERGYHCEAYPVIAKVLEWAGDPEGSGFRLRVPHLKAQEKGTTAEFVSSL